MTRMAVVSSYAESCGNASFTKVVVNSVSRYSTMTAEGVGLPLMLTQSLDRQIRAGADDAIRQMAEVLRTYDAVNLQVETGLYGTRPADVLRRIKILLDANPNTTVTLHAPRLITSLDEWHRNAYRSALRLRLGQALKNYVGGINANKYVAMNRKLVGMVAAAKRPIIVHTQRSKTLISTIVGYDNVHVHPLRIVPPDFRPQPEVLQRLRERNGIAPGAKVIGIFGYVSRYKGHLDAIKALSRLPQEYVLLIAGRQHPQTIRPEMKDGFIAELEAQIDRAPRNQRLAERVFFVGELPDDDFMSVAACVDVCWLPYYELGQDGSGIASICLDLNPRVLCSASLAFDELFRLLPYRNYMRFDIGNATELAQKTRAIVQAPTVDPALSSNAYSQRSQALLYAGLAGATARAATALNVVPQDAA